MSEDSTVENASPTEPATSRRVLPTLRLWCVIVALLGIVVTVQMTDPFGDQAISNICTLIGVFTCLVSYCTWFARKSGFQGRVRWVPGAVLFACVILPVPLFYIDGTSGELIPRIRPRFTLLEFDKDSKSWIPSFRFRWTQQPDTLLEIPVAQKPVEASDENRMAQTTPHDFPGFLGPGRNARITNVELNRDWESHSPEEVWRRKIGAGWAPFSIVNGLAVTMEQRGEFEMTTCYDVATGELVWQNSNKARYETVMGGIGPRSAPTIDQGRVYSCGATGMFKCLDGRTGELLWSVDVPEEFGIPSKEDKADLFYGRANSPLIVDDLVIIAVGGRKSGEKTGTSLAAFDKVTGELKWKGGDQQASYASPVLGTLAGKEQILITNESSVSGHDVKSGDVLWSFKWPGHSNTDASCTNAVPIPPNRVFISKGYSVGCAMWEVSETGAGKFDIKEVWHARRMKSKFANVVVAGDYVYGLSDGKLECVRLEDGKRQWLVRGDYDHGQILAVGDLLIVQSEQGHVALVELNPEEFVELGRIDALSDRTWNNPALYGEYLLVRNASEAVCYRLKLKKPDAR